MAENLPFRVNTRVEGTPKRAIAESTLRKLETLSLRGFSQLGRVRDLFMFSFFTCGMSFVDMAYLRKKDVVGNEIVYRRRKCGTVVRVCMTEKLRRLLKRVSPSGEGDLYLLPILRSDKGGLRKQYLSALRNFNLQLKKLGGRICEGLSLSSYVARYSWATQARRIGMPVSCISQALGHRYESTTLIYLDSIDAQIIYQWNERIVCWERGRKSFFFEKSM